MYGTGNSSALTKSKSSLHNSLLLGIFCFFSLHNSLLLYLATDRRWRRQRHQHRQHTHTQSHYTPFTLAMAFNSFTRVHCILFCCVVHFALPSVCWNNFCNVVAVGLIAAAAAATATTTAAAAVVVGDVVPPEDGQRSIQNIKLCIIV